MGVLCFKSVEATRVIPTSPPTREIESRHQQARGQTYHSNEQHSKNNGDGKGSVSTSNSFLNEDVARADESLRKRLKHFWDGGRNQKRYNNARSNNPNHQTNQFKKNEKYHKKSSINSDGEATSANADIKPQKQTDIESNPYCISYSPVLDTVVLLDVKPTSSTNEKTDPDSQHEQKNPSTEFERNSPDASTATSIQL